MNKISGVKQNNRDLYVLLGLMAFEFIRFQDNLLPFLGTLRIPMFFSIYLIFYVLKSYKEVLKDPILKLCVLFSLMLVFSLTFATNTFHAYHVSKIMVLNIFAVAAMVLILNTRERLETFVKWFVLIFFIVALIVIKNGGRGPGGFLKDENDVALLMGVALPYPWYMLQHVPLAKFKKIFYIVCLLVISMALVATSSRGGLLGFVAMLAMLVILSAKPIRNMLISLTLVVVVGTAALTVLPDTYVKDMRTISDTGDSTRNLRFMHWTAAYEMFKDNPVLGVGAGNYPWNSNRYFHYSRHFDPTARNRSGRQSHSLYFTLIPETGLVGIFIFISILVKIYVRARKMIKDSISNSDPDKSQLFYVLASKITLAALVAYLVAGVFISVLYYPVFWFLCGFFAALFKVWEGERSGNLPKI